MRRTVPLILLLALPAVACAAPGTEAGDSPSPPVSATPKASASPSPTVTRSPQPWPSRTAIAWADMPPVSPTSIDYEPDQLGPPRGSAPVDTAISALVDREPTKYTAVIINTPGFIVTLPDGPDLAERKKAAQATTKAPIDFVIAVRSRAEQSRLQDQLVKSLMMDDKENPPEITGIGSDPRGAVRIYCNYELDTLELRKKLKKQYGVQVVFEPGGVGELLEGR
jgi:hypothetical protein